MRPRVSESHQSRAPSATGCCRAGSPGTLEVSSREGAPPRPLRHGCRGGRCQTGPMGGPPCPQDRAPTFAATRAVAGDRPRRRAPARMAGDHAGFPCLCVAGSPADMTHPSRQRYAQAAPPKVSQGAATMDPMGESGVVALLAGRTDMATRTASFGSLRRDPPWAAHRGSGGRGRRKSPRALGGPSPRGAGAVRGAQPLLIAPAVPKVRTA